MTIRALVIPEHAQPGLLLGGQGAGVPIREAVEAGVVRYQGGFVRLDSEAEEQRKIEFGRRELARALRGRVFAQTLAGSVHQFR